MNKTIIININGIVFHIEEDAYETLRQYMIDVKRHFAYSPDNDEIVADIENRIAEMFNERIAEDKRQVVVAADVAFVIEQMGQVNQFEETAGDSSYQEYDYASAKKLYRDLDDRIVGGVCSGIAHYFNADPKWVRIIAVLIVFLGGSGLLIYAILWMIIPKAKTVSEKMAMKGEPVNLHNLKRNFDEEVDALRNNLNRAHREAAPALKHAGNFIESLIQNFAKFLGGLGKIIIKLIGIFIIIVGTGAFIAFLGAMIGLLGFWDATQLSFFPFNIVNPEYETALYFGAFVLIAIPLISLILFALRIVLNRQIVTKTGSFTLLIIWITGLILTIYYGTKLGSEFNQEATFSQVTSIKPQPVYYIRLNTEKYFSHDDSVQLNLNGINKKRIIIDDDFGNFNSPQNIRLFIEKSDSDEASITQLFIARGKTYKSALSNAEEIDYKLVHQDSVIELPAEVYLKRNSLWRGQEVKVTIKVPANSRLVFDGRLNRFLDNVNLWECKPENSRYEDLSDFIMTKDGLKCSIDSLNKRNTENE